MEQQYPSVLLEKAVSEFSRLPGIGRKTALRLVLHLLKTRVEDVESFSSSILKMRTEIKYCQRCHNISDTETCDICANPRRDASTICVVENIQDVMAIENTQQFNGLYHVLGGKIDPLNGVTIDDLNIGKLMERLDGTVHEIILALNPDLEGETTSLYLTKFLKAKDVKISKIASGIPMGGNIEYTDMATLGRSLEGRINVDDEN